MLRNEPEPTLSTATKRNAIRLTGRVTAMQESSTLAVLNRATALIAQGVDIVDFGPGEPDFRTPPSVAAAGKRAIDEGFTRYTNTGGVKELREAIADRYNGFPLSNVSYATVRDYADSIEHLSPLTTAQGDLKDVQRPWTLKAILSSVPAGGRVLEIGGGQPYVADILARLGYDVWLVDPYDGSGNGPIEYEAFKRGAPGVKFVRELFDDRLNDLPSAAFDCIYSISVIEHISQPKLAGVIAGMKRGLVSAGVSIQIAW